MSASMMQMLLATKQGNIGPRISLGTNNNTTGATIALTGLTVPAGVAVFVAVMEQNGSATPGTGSVADGTNGAYSAGPTTGADNCRLSLFYFLNAAALASGTVTFTKGGSGNRASISAFYASGVATTSALDASVTATQNTVTGNPPVYSLTSGSPSESGELLVGLVGTRCASTAPTFTQDTTNGWATPPDYANTIYEWGAGGTLVNAGSGTKTFSPTSTAPGGTVTALMLIAGFKAA